MVTNVQATSDGNAYRRADPQEPEVDVEKQIEISRDDLLYDGDRLLEMRDEFGPATEIKRHVQTTAMIYEIRTALKYWSGESQTHRTCGAVWRRCELVEEGVDRSVVSEL
ncbi:hypothetical protein [Natrinema sp. DC36]|uniref:hypothetical protein n=1 Tax=Natrinema sp. DC36 TaxID=2878680 RepID=UPI001CF02296|nr:hypothetical protein [Natrinema sp. DC36]